MAWVTEEAALKRVWERILGFKTGQRVRVREEEARYFPSYLNVSGIIQEIIEIHGRVFLLVSMDGKLLCFQDKEMEVCEETKEE